MPDSNQLAQIMATMARVDERTLAMQKEIAELKENNADKIETLKATVDSMKKSQKEDLDALKKQMKDDYVMKESFTPVQRIVYGIVSIILTAVTMAIIGFVILK